MKGAARIAIACAALAGAGQAVAQQQPGVWLIGTPPGMTSGLVSAVSQNGDVAVGVNASFIPVLSAGFRWTRAGGRYDFGLEPGMLPATPARGVSSDGTVLVGAMWTPISGQPPPDQRAFRRSGNGPMESLGLLPNEERSYATGVSGDGTIVVGRCEHTTSVESFGQAFRWTNPSGMQGLGYARPLGTYSEARAISRNGSTIVGRSQSGGLAGPNDAFVWTQPGGMQALPGLPGATATFNDANAVSADGSVVVGDAITASLRSHAVRWTSTGVQDLGILPGFNDSLAFAVSDDGNVVGGVMDVGSTSTAFVWTESAGMSLLSDFLTFNGVMPPAGYRLEVVRAISGDGLTFGGEALNLATNAHEGFVATVPSPSSLLIFALPALIRRRRFAA